MNKMQVLAAGLVVLSTALPAYGDVPGFVTYSGRLTDGTAWGASEQADLTFWLCTQPQGDVSDCTWSETHAGVPLEDGYFSVRLGQATPLPSPLPGSTWLAVAVDGEPPLIPRQPVGAVPFALEAGNTALLEQQSLADLDGRYVHKDQGGAVTGEMIQDGAVGLEDLGQSGCAEGDALRWSGAGWACEDVSSTSEAADLFVDAQNPAGDEMSGPLLLPADGLVVGESQLVAAGGNVGIGTAAPTTFNNASRTLEVSAAAAGSSGIPGIVLRAGAMYSTNPAWELFLKKVGETGTGFSVSSGSSTALHLRSNGNLGIGTFEPTSPNGRDRVVEINAASSGSSATPGLVLKTGSLYSNPAWEMFLNSVGGLDTGFNIASGTNTAVHIRKSGNVGIGTSAPDAPLHVGGPTDDDYSPLLILGNWVDKKYGLRFSTIPGPSYTIDVTGGQNADYTGLFVNYRGYYGGTQYYRDFTVADGKEGVVAFFDGSEHRFGIGTSKPARSLHIAGEAGSAEAKMRIGQGDSNGNISGEVGLASWNTNGSLYLDVAKVGVGRGTVILAPYGGNVGVNTQAPTYQLHVNGSFFATSINAQTCPACASDIRLKKAIEPVRNALDRLLRLTGVTFEFDRAGHPDMNLPEGRQMGLVAQEVERVAPELVMTPEGDGFKAIKYGNAVALVIEAMKEQQSLLDELTSRLERLESENRSLRSTNDEMAERLERLEMRLVALEGRKVTAGRVAP